MTAEIVVNPVYRSFFEDHPETLKRIRLMIGGRGSGKSRVVAQKLAVEALKKRQRIGLVRKVRDNIRDSQWKEIRDAVAGTTLEKHFTFVSNPLSIRVSNGSEFVCKGLDDAEKVKSLAEVSKIWVEEITEIREDEFVTLDLSIRGDGHKEIIATCNPINSFVKGYFFLADGRTLRNPDEVWCLRTTYRDNHFRGAAFDAVMDRLRERDPQRYARDGEGLWVDMQGLIYEDYDIVDSWPEGVTRFYGTDFGYNDPHATVAVGLRDGVLYVDEVLHQSGLDSEGVHLALSARMSDDKHRPNYCDSARPEMIAYLAARGWNVHAAAKGKGSVAGGISFVKSHRLAVTRRSSEVLKELTGYHWLSDRAGKLLEEPSDYDNHAMDAMRYGAVGAFFRPATPFTQTSIRKREAAVW